MYDSNVMVVRTSSTRRRAFDDDVEIPSFSRRAAHISNHVLDDADAIRHASRRHDAHLLNDITSRLCRLEFDAVKPGLDVALQTGFRRHIYHTKRPPLSKEQRLAMRKDRLRYPWDYTKDNLYRPPRHVKKTPKEQLKERVDGDPYPIHDPFALYRARPKHEHVALEDNGLSIREQYAKMSPRQILAHAKAKALTAPDQRDPSDDIDSFLRELSRPLPKTSVAAYVPYTGDLYDFDIIYDDGVKLDPFVSEKIQSSKADLDAFERMLNDRQTARIKRPLVHVAEFQQRLRDLPRDDGRDGEFDLGLDDYYGLEDEMPISRRHYPTRTVVTASHHQHSGAGLVSGRPPLPSRVHPRAAKYMMDTSYDYSPAASHVTPTSYTSLRSRAAECRSKMDHQKVLLDRYLPVQLGPGNDVQYEVEAKYGELAARMPALDPRRPRDTYRSSSVPPYRPAPRPSSGSSGYSSSYTPRTPSCRPPVSDVRKRCRDVLCKTKNDPTYYNY